MYFYGTSDSDGAEDVWRDHNYRYCKAGRSVAYVLLSAVPVKGWYSDPAFQWNICRTSERNKEYRRNQQISVFIFQQAKENERLLKAVLRAKLYEMVLKCFIQYCSYLVEKIFGQDQGLDPVTADYLIYEEAGRFSLLLLRWVERGMKESPEKMAKMMEQIEVNLTK